MEIYDYEESNPILDINQGPTVNIRSLYIYILKDENNIIFNHLNFEEIYVLLNNFINIFRKNTHIITKNADTTPILHELHMFIYRLFIKISNDQERSLKIHDLIRNNMDLMVMSNGNTIMHNIITNSFKFKGENTLGCFLTILVQSGIKRNGRDKESLSPLFLAIDCDKSSETLDTLLN